MVTIEKDTKVPNSTTDIFTTDHKPVHLEFNSNLNYDWNQSYNFGCMYLLPCGLCMKTDKPCPKYKGQNWQPYVIYTNSTNNSQTNTINTNYTTGESKND